MGNYSIKGKRQLHVPLLELEVFEQRIPEPLVVLLGGPDAARDSHPEDVVEGGDVDGDVVLGQQLDGLDVGQRDGGRGVLLRSGRKRYKNNAHSL